MRRRAVEQRELSQRPGARVITLNVIFSCELSSPASPWISERLIACFRLTILFGVVSTNSRSLGRIADRFNCVEHFIEISSMRFAIQGPDISITLAASAEND